MRKAASILNVLALAALPALCLKVPPLKGRSCQPEEKSIASVVKEYVEIYKNYIVDYNQAHSSAVGCRHSCVDFIDKNFTKDRSLFLKGKSFGGDKTYRMLREDWEIVNKYKKLVVLFVDTHSPFPSLIGNVRNLSLKSKWKDKQNSLYFNVFQKQKYPKGASIPNADLNLEIENNVDHFNIVHKWQVKELLDCGFDFLIPEV